MTKEQKLEECETLPKSSENAGPSSSGDTATLQKKPLDISNVSAHDATVNSVETPGSCQSAGSVISPPASKMMRSSKSDLRNMQKCTIRLLDDNEVLQTDFQPHYKGQFLMDYVCRQLNIAEKDYFGLRYVDSSKNRHWLDLGKSIIKQLKDNAYILCFRYKFYPNDPMALKEEVTRYQLVLQLRRDILHGRLYSTLSDMATIVSFILQSELGDYDPEVHSGNYAAEYELVSRQTQELEEKGMELHQKLCGLTPTEADTLFLKKAATLDTYGLDPYPVKDQHGEQIYLGINHTGISTFQHSRKVTHFKWSQITKLNYEAKMFIVHISIPEDSRIKKKETIGFKCQSSSACKYLWRCAVEQRLFFNCGSSADVPSSVRGGGIFGSRFKYHGRVQREILEDHGPLRSSDAVIQRTPLYRSLQRSKTRSLPHSPSHPGYGSLPRSNHSAPPSEGMRLDTSGYIGSSASLPLSTLSSPYCPDHNTLPMLETLQENDSPRMEEKGRGTKLQRNDSIRSTASVLSTLSRDDPDLTFLQNRMISVEDADLLRGKDGLKCISEEHEDTEKYSSGTNGSIKTGNGHISKLGGNKVCNGNLARSNGTDAEFVYDGAQDATKSGDERGLRDSKIDARGSSSQPGKPRSSFSAIVKIFMICFICVIVSLLCVAIMVIEIDLDFCRRMRHIPEVEWFQFDVYEPFKTYLRSKFHAIEHFHP